MTESNEGLDRSSLPPKDWHESRSVEAVLGKTDLELPQEPITIREIVALGLLILTSDVTLYRSRGFAGPGTFLLVAPVFLCIGVVWRKFDRRLWLLAATGIHLILRDAIRWCRLRLDPVVYTQLSRPDRRLPMRSRNPSFFGVRPTRVKVRMGVPWLGCCNRRVERGVP